MVIGLIAKRQEIANAVEALQSHVKQAVTALDRIEASLRIFKPDIDLLEVGGVRPVPPPHAAFKGEVTQIVISALKTAGRPMTCRELTEILMQERGLSVENKRLFRTMTQRVGAMHNHWKRVKGVRRSMPGEGQTLLWEIDQRRLDDRRRSAEMALLSTAPVR